MMAMEKFKNGIAAWKRALDAVRTQKSLRVFVALPLALNGLLLTLLLFFMFSNIQPWLMAWVMEWMGTTGWWLGLLNIFSYLVTLILWALLVVPTYAVSNLLMAPVHSLAAEKVLKTGGVKYRVPENLAEWLRFFGRSLWIGLIKSVMLMILAVPLFLGGFLPGLGIVFVYLSFVILAFDCTDYSLEVLGLGLRARFSYLKAHLWEYLGFSLVFFVVGFIPLAMIFVLPLGIIAGAHLVAELERSTEEQRTPM